MPGGGRSEFQEQFFGSVPRNGNHLGHRDEAAPDQIIPLSGYHGLASVSKACISHSTQEEEDRHASQKCPDFSGTRQNCLQEKRSQQNRLIDKCPVKRSLGTLNFLNRWQIGKVKVARKSEEHGLSKIQKMDAVESVGFMFRIQKQGPPTGTEENTKKRSDSVCKKGEGFGRI